MTFWLEVALAYLLLIAGGLALGRFLALRFPGNGWGGPSDDPTPPAPSDPTHAVEWPPLGSAFDRALLPGAFDGEPVRDRAGLS